MTTNNPRRIFAEIAREELWVRETSRNQGPGIAKYWPDTTYPNGYQNREPWCAAFVCWVVAEAIRRGHGPGPRPRSASVREIVKWARRNGSGAQIFSPTFREPQAGDLVWFTFGGLNPNHIEIVCKRGGANRIGTIGGNTNMQGGREGNGVYERTRSLNACAGFIRLAWQPIP